jgi:elongation factor Ts
MLARSAVLLRLNVARVDMKTIQELRFRTDAPISDCNMALKECNLDLDAAAEWLRKKGIAKANKKEGRVTDHGLGVAILDAKYGAAVLSICSETDFACRNEKFVAAASAVKQKYLDMIAATNGAALSGSDDVVKELSTISHEILASTIAVLGENIVVKSIVPLALPSGEIESEEIRQLPLAFGKYVHNSCTGDSDAGSIVGLVAVRKLPVENGDHSAMQIEDLAQHFVGSSGDTSNYIHQSFLGSDDTVGQWLKKNHVKLASSMVIPFGKQPIITLPAAGRPPRPPVEGKQ